ncbi:hypothetical protein BGZ52_001078 [Haplosporangium bisporale]|nr:hypothetical protein BGZ52_001078 [Haplosporangium bisporale]KFH72421.1 hypothetical protein MVEG_02712 [Podila verticillata NRRL 6337]
MDEKIMHLHNQGFSWTQISEAVGVPYSCCYTRYRTSLDPNIDSFWTKKRLALLEKMALEGRSWKDIARSLQAGQEKSVSTIACQNKWDKIGHHYRSDLNLSPRNLATVRTEIEKFHSANKSLDWDNIAGVLGNKFTGSQLMYKYSLVTRGASRWKRSQDMDLIKNVMLAAAKTRGKANKQDALDTIDWAQIADQVGHHTPQECESRWQKMRSRLVQKREVSPSGNFWSENEMEAYWKAWTAFGNDWDKIAGSLPQVLWTRDSENLKDSVQELPRKTAQDCRTDFDYLVRESDLKSDLLKPALGDFVEMFSMQPRRRAKWTTEQIRRLMDSVRQVHDAKQKKLREIGSSSFETLPSIYNMDWDEVARLSGGEFTPGQCKYRWDRETHPDKFLSSATGAWTRKETQALERALKDSGLLSCSTLVKKLPQKFINSVKDQYNVERSSRGIMAKAWELLRKHHGDISPAGNRARLSSLVNMGLPIDGWTAEEDRRLLKATYETGHTHWDRISRLVFHRKKSAWQCRLRSVQLQQDDGPGVEEPPPISDHRLDLPWIKGQREWTELEQRHLFDAVEKHGMFGNWDKVQQYIARRHNDDDDSSVFQIRSVEEVKQEYWRLNTFPHATTKSLSKSDTGDRPSPSAPGNTSEGAAEESLPRLSHPQMFLAPGIMKIRDKNLRHDLRKEGVVDPDLGQGQFGFVWWPADEKKFADLIAKYGTSTVSWRLISEKMSIPIKKCQDKLRKMEQFKGQQMNKK